MARTRRTKDDIKRAVLVGLRTNPGRSAAELGVTTSQIKEFVEKGHVEKTGVRAHEKDGKPSRGRPVFLWGLTKNGKDAARRVGVKV